jgi:glycosyltransferase involved in cell wall biosynthesis
MRKKVVICIDWFLPGEKAGGPVRSIANMVSHLHHDFDFYIITRNTDYTEEQPYPSVPANEWYNFSENVSVYYFSANQLTKSNVAKVLLQLTPDVVYLNGMWSKEFTRWPLSILKKNNFTGKTILAVRGMLAPSALQIKKYKKKLFLQVAKWRHVYSGIVFHATNETEREQVLDIFGQDAQVKVAPNLARMDVDQVGIHHRKRNDVVSLVAIARIAPEKNPLFLIEQLQHCKTPVHISWYGPVYDESYKLECEAAIAKLPPHVQFLWKGALESSQIPEVLQQSDAIISPTRGENFGHTILESLQAGVPVIISDRTPWNEVVRRNAGFVVSLDDDLGFVTAIAQLANMNDAVYASYCKSAVEFAQEFVSNPEHLAKNRELLN